MPQQRKLMFGRPKGGQPTRHLFVGNCGPGVGIDSAAIGEIFGEFGPASVVVPEQQQNPRSAFIFVSYPTVAHATAALEALDQQVCAAAGQRLLAIKYADLKKDKEPAAEQSVATSTDVCPVSGLALVCNFVSAQEEQALLKCAEEGEWETLARRRVCHFGYKFEYEVRNVNPDKPGQKFPQAMQPILERVKEHPAMPEVDQCTVNEYPAGVGLSPHIDTHSAFTGAIASLSLAGHAVMEFRQDGQAFALLLPPRSLLVMAGPARYCWHHYIPHRKADWVNGCLLPRSHQRVSFTFRQVRGYPCNCNWPEHCDSQQGSLPPTRMATKAPATASTHACSQPQQLYPHAQQSAPTNSDHHDGASGHSDQEANGLFQHSTAHTATRLESTDWQSTACPEQTPHNRRLQGQDEVSAEGRATRIDTPAQQSLDQLLPNHHQEEQRGLSGEADLQRLEQEFVHDVYNAIAPHFSSTRFAIWPKVRLFIEGLRAGAVVADVGCGNGKYFLVRPDIAVLGSDRSSGLAAMAATRLQAGLGSASGNLFKADVAVADGMKLPYASQRFDAVLCIAVLHHITSPARRIEMLTELLRVLRPGGKALVTAWATEQEDMKKLAKWHPIPQPGDQSHNDASMRIHNAKSDVSSVAAAVHSDSEATTASGAHRATSAGQVQVKQAGNDYFVPWHLPFHRAEAAMQVLKAGSASSGSTASSIRVDDKRGAVVFSRYYHVFEQFELDHLVQQVPQAEVLESFYDKDNWCVVVGRTN